RSRLRLLRVEANPQDRSSAGASLSSIKRLAACQEESQQVSSNPLTTLIMGVLGVLRFPGSRSIASSLGLLVNSPKALKPVIMQRILKVNLTQPGRHGF